MDSPELESNKDGKGADAMEKASWLGTHGGVQGPYAED